MWWVGLRCHDATRLTDKIRPDPTDPTYPTKVSGRLMATRPDPTDPTDPTKPDRPDHKSATSNIQINWKFLKVEKVVCFITFRNGLNYVSNSIGIRS